MGNLAYVPYPIELTGPTMRGVVGMMSSVYFSLGYMFSSFLAYYFPDWRNYTLAVDAVF